MPLTPIDYSKCKIYRIVCKDFSVPCTYVGSTTDMIRRRASHKNRCNSQSDSGHNCKIYQQIRANGGWDNWVMLLVEDYPCNGHEAASARERYWLEQFEADLNSNMPNRSRAEWREDHRESARDYASAKITCVCGSEHSRGNKTMHLKSKKHQKFISANNIEASIECYTESNDATPPN